LSFLGGLFLFYSFGVSFAHFFFAATTFHEKVFQMQVLVGKLSFKQFQVIRKRLLAIEGYSISVDV
jgi:hypothetical protein